MIRNKYSLKRKSTRFREYFVYVHTCKFHIMWYNLAIMKGEIKL